MPEIVRAALVQQAWTGDKDSMIAAAVRAYPDGRLGQGRRSSACRSCSTGRTSARCRTPTTTPTPRRSRTGRPPRLLQDVARQLSIVIIAPMYEEEQPGLYYNTAAVIDADGSYLGKYRKTHIPQVKGFWEKFYFRPGNLGYPVFDTAVGRIGVYICYDRHFPEGWRALGLAGARIVFNPSATSPRACRSTCGGSSSPPPRSPTSTSSARSTGSASSRSATTTSTASPTSSTRAASWSARPPSDDEDEVVVRDLDMDQLDRGAGPVAVLPRPPPRLLRARLVKP